MQIFLLGTVSGRMNGREGTPIHLRHTKHFSSGENDTWKQKDAFDWVNSVLADVMASPALPAIHATECRLMKVPLLPSNMSRLSVTKSFFSGALVPAIKPYLQLNMQQHSITLTVYFVPSRKILCLGGGQIGGK